VSVRNWPVTSPSSGSVDKHEGPAWTPDVGARVVLVYPPEWNKPDLYGEVLNYNDDGTFYILEPILGSRRVINNDNLVKHGAYLRRLRPKEKWPSAKAYVTPKEKRAIKEKRALKLEKQ